MFTRRERGLSQEAVALRSGIERGHLGKMERGEHMPSLIAVMKVAVALDCEPFEIMAWVQSLLPKDYILEVIMKQSRGRQVTE